MKKGLQAFSGQASQRGQGFVEYGLLLTLVAIGIVLGMSLAGVSVSDLYCRAATAIGGGEACQGLETYCEDNFEGDASGWQSLSGKTLNQGGQMCFSNYMQNLNRCSMKMPEKDYVIDMNGVTLKQGNGFGIYFRSTVDKNGLDGYAFQYDPGAMGNGNKNGSFLIRRWINGVEVITPIAIAPMSGAATYNVPHDFKVVVKGDVYTVFMDGNQILKAKDSTYPTGGTGLRSWDSTSGCFNDFSISQTPKQETP